MGICIWIWVRLDINSCVKPAPENAHIIFHSPFYLIDPPESKGGSWQRHRDLRGCNRWWSWHGGSEWYGKRPWQWTCCSCWCEFSWWHCRQIIISARQAVCLKNCSFFHMDTSLCNVYSYFQARKMKAQCYSVPSAYVIQYHLIYDHYGWNNEFYCKTQHIIVNLTQISPSIDTVLAQERNCRCTNDCLMYWKTPFTANHFYLHWNEHN